MSSTSTSSSSPPSQVSTMHPPGSAASTSSASSADTRPSTPGKARQVVKLMLDVTQPGLLSAEERRARRRSMKQQIFEHSNVDWKSIPAFDDREDLLSRDDLNSYRHLRCEASWRYRDEIITKYCRPVIIDFGFGGEVLSNYSDSDSDDEDFFVDMIG